MGMGCEGGKLQEKETGVKWKENQRKEKKINMHKENANTKYIGFSST